MVSRSLETINQDKEALRHSYEMTDLGDLTWILGMHITCDRSAGRISVLQEKYCNNVLK
jgi:hypothetical protein